MRNEKYSGYWWVEGEEGNRIPGELTLFHNSMPTLELQGAFFPDKSDLSGSSYRIYGESGGEIITLPSCSRDSYSTSTGPFGTSTQASYVASYCTIGFPFISNNISFDELYVELEGIERWAWADGIDMDMKMANPPRWQAGDELYIKYTQPKSLTTWINGQKISFNITPQQNISKGNEAKIGITQRFKIEPRRCQVPINDILPVISKIQDFVSFAAGGSVGKSKIEGKIRGEDVEVVLPEKVETDIPSHPNRMLLHLSDIRTNFSTILQNWFFLSNKYQEVIDMYSGSAYNPQIYPRNELQNYVHVLESYHRRKFGVKYMDKWVFHYFLRDIRDLLKGNPSNVYSGASHNLRDMYDIPDPMVQSLSDGALKYSNEYSLRKRLTDLVNNHRSILTNLPYSIEGKVGLLKDTRNYFAHYTDELRKKAVTSGAELRKLVWGAKQLIEVCLLKELGMSESFIENKMKMAYKNKFVKPV